MQRSIMKEIIIEPNIGIDQLKLGMTSDEIEAAFLRMRNDWAEVGNTSVQPSNPIIESPFTEIFSHRLFYENMD